MSKTGYDSGLFGTATSPATEESMEPETRTGLIAGDFAVNIRRMPDKDSEVVATVRKGTKAVILEDKGNHFLVKADGKTGYVPKRFVKEG